MRRIQREVTLPLRVMVRESDGFACGSDEERRALAEHAAAFSALGVDGIVVGWVRGGRIDEETLGCVLDAAPAVRATFHRAFDSLPDPRAALRTLRGIGRIDRVLTGGGAGPWSARCATLQQYARWAGGNLRMLPGGGIDEDAVRALVRCDAVTEVHVGRAARAGRAVEGRVSASLVETLKRAAGER